MYDDKEVLVTLPLDDVVEGDIAKRFWAMARDIIYGAWMESAKYGYGDVPESLLMLCTIYDTGEFERNKAAHDQIEKARKERNGV